MSNKFKLLSACAAFALAANAYAGVYVGYKMDASSKESCGWNVNRGSISTAEGVMTYDEGQNNSSSLYNSWGEGIFESINQKAPGANNFYFTATFSITPGNDVACYKGYTADGVLIFDEGGKGHNYQVKETITNEDGTTTEVKFSDADEVAYEQWTQQGMGIYFTGAQSSILKKNWWDDGKNYVFALQGLMDKAQNPDPVNAPKFAVCGDTENPIDLVPGAFYTVSLTVDTLARKTTYSLVDAEGVEVVSGSYDVDAAAAILPTSLYVGANRYQAKFACKQLIAGKEVEGDVPNNPTYRIAEVLNDLRRYMFDFNEGETMYYECEPDVAMDLDEFDVTTGFFTYDQIASAEAGLYSLGNGVIKIWTEIGGRKSDVVEIECENSIIKLPTPTCSLVGVYEGYGKDFKIEIDNTNVLTRPDIMFCYIINGDTIKANQASGSKINIPDACAVKVVATKFGFKSSDPLIIINNQYYSIKTDLDFEHMTADDFAKYSFSAMDPLSSATQSGESNWTARLRLYDYIVVDPDTTLYYAPDYTVKRAVVNKELAAHDGTYPTVNRYQYATAANEMDSTTAMMFAPLMLPNKDVNYGKANYFQIKEGIGLLNNEALQNDVPYYFRGMEEGEYALVYKINGYGSNASHGYFSSIEEAKASYHGELTDVVPANGSFNLYRIDTAISRIVILTEDESKKADVELPAEEEESALKHVKAKRLDNIVRDLSGRQVKHLTRGIYVKNGKSFIVK